MELWETRSKVSQWLRIRIRDEKRLASRNYGSFLDQYKEGILTKEQAVHQFFNQLAADVDHSSLLQRLLSGKEALPEPPPTEHSYPVYPD